MNKHTERKPIMFGKERFGNNIPKNWEEICNYLDWLLDCYVKNYSEGDEDMGELANELWEEYSAGNLHLAPKAIM